MNKFKYCFYLFLYLPAYAGAGNIYEVKYDYQADVKVYKVEYDYQADLIVYECEYDYRQRIRIASGISYNMITRLT